MGEKAVVVAPEADPLRELAAECISLLRHCIEHAAEAEDAMVQCRIGDGLLAKFAKMKQAEDETGKRSKAVEDWLAGMASASEPLRKHMEGLRAKARKLLEKRKVLKGLHGTAHFHKWLVMNAAEYREHFTLHALDLEKSLSNFRVMGRVDPKYGLFDILGHIQNEDARKFWKESISSEVWRADWKRFSVAIHRHMDRCGLPIGEESIQRIKYALCVGHGDSAGVSCFAFNQAAQRHGFPFETNVMPDRPHKEAEKAELTLGEKLLLAREVAELVQKYQSYEMLNAIRGIKDFVAAEGPGASDRWAMCLKDAQLLGHTKEQHKRAAKLDEFRRKWAHFFTRFMMLWRIGPVAHDLFADLDFPNESHVIDFLRTVEPFDEAALRTLHKGDKHEWEKHRPKVYPFLRLLLRERKVPEMSIPPPYAWQSSGALAGLPTPTMVKKSSFAPGRQHSISGDGNHVAGSPSASMTSGSSGLYSPTFPDTPNSNSMHSDH